MAKVYVVTTGEYSSFGISAIFSAREKAAGYAKELGTDNDIEEYELDERAGETARTMRGLAEIYLESGDVAEPTYLRSCYGRGCLFPVSGYRIHKWLNIAQPLVAVESAISDEHALKIAAEYRQAWLRTKTEFQPLTPVP